MLWRGGKGPPFLQYMPKGSSWVMQTLMQLRRRIGKHQNVQEEQTCFEEGQSAKSDKAKDGLQVLYLVVASYQSFEAVHAIETFKALQTVVRNLKRR